MRLFDDDKIGCYLDAIGHRVEKTKNGDDLKVVDLTLRVQPFTASTAVSVDPDVRALLFAMTDGEPKPLIKAVELALPIPNQRLTVYAAPDMTEASAILHDVEITRPRARTEKDVDGFGFVFYASVGPVDGDTLEYLQRWHTEQRFVTFEQQQPALNFDPPADEAPRHVAH
jgi:hypothetical protein